MLLVTSQLTASNMLAVAYVTEADDIFATVLLPPAARRVVDELVSSVLAARGREIFVPWLTIRIRGIGCVAMLITCIFDAEALICVWHEVQSRLENDWVNKQEDVVEGCSGIIICRQSAIEPCGRSFCFQVA